MTLFVWQDGQWVIGVRWSRPQVFPSIISDAMDALIHPADGQKYDSKSQFRRVTAEHGLVELGNDAPMSRPVYEPQGVADDVAESIQKLEQGYQEAPLEYATELEGAPIDTRIIE